MAENRRKVHEYVKDNEFLDREFKNEMKKEVGNALLMFADSLAGILISSLKNRGK